MKQELEAMLFAYGKPVKVSVLANILERNENEVKSILEEMKNDYADRGIELINIENSYTFVTKKEYYNSIYKLFETRSKPNISNAAMEVLSIIAYNPNVTKPEIEKIRGVNSDGTINKLVEFELIEDTGRLDVPGRPITYGVTENFYKLFGYSSLDELPKLNFDGGNNEENIEQPNSEITEQQEQPEITEQSE